MTQADKGSSLALAGDWRIGRLEPQRALLLELLQSKPAVVELDAAGITHLDTLGLQLLAVFAQQCARQQVTIRWTAPAPLLEEGAARLGLAAILALPADDSASVH